ncbi:Equilibrative nucleoside transporter 1 [Halotydeus destructor]|nr:Equilibrative nucleoside transporter 1 [Halotydeus destructor]
MITTIPAIPVDKYNLVFIILLINGVGTLLPWNMFITANSYYSSFKLNVTADNETSTYSENYLQYVGIASKLPNVIVQGVNFLVPAQESSLTIRIIVSIIAEAILFAVTTALTIIDSTSWTGLFFYVTMASVVLINIANGVYQNCIFGVTAVLPMSYTNAVVTGMNISGVFAALVMILSISVSPDPQVSAFWYFLSAVIFLIICLVSYFILIRMPFYESHYEAKSEDNASQANKISLSTYLQIFKECWPQLVNVFLVYVISLSIFPAVLADVKPLDGVISEKYFSSTVCFLLFNLSAMLGNLMVNDSIPKIPPTKLWIAIVARVIFIPFFLYCNYLPDKRSWPVVIETDAIFALGVAIFALSSGYLSSLCMVYAPKSVASEHAPIAGMMASFSLMMGILLGLSSSFIYAAIVR